MSQNRTLIEHAREVWDTRMRGEIDGLGDVRMTSYRRRADAITWVGEAPAGRVVTVRAAEVASWIGRHVRRPVPASDVLVAHGRHPGEVVVTWRRIDPLGAPIAPPELVPASIHDGTEVGRREDGGPAILRWSGGHTLVVGTTGSGKSTLLRYIAAALTWCPDGDIWVSETGKAGEDFEGLEVDRLATTPADLASMMADLDAIAAARAGTPRHTRRPIVLLIDEFAVARDSLAAALKKSRSTADEVWTRAFSLWRSAGIALIVGAQRGTVEYVPAGPRANALQRVCLRVGSAAEWGFMAADPSMPGRHAWSPADFTEHAGMMALQPMGSSEWLRCRMWHLPGGGEQAYAMPDVDAVAPRPIGREPWGPPDPSTQGTIGGSTTPWTPETARSDRVGPPVDPRAAVLAALGADPAGKDTISRQVGLSPSTVRRILDTLAAEGAATQTPRGWIAAADTQEHTS